MPKRRPDVAEDKKPKNNPSAEFIADLLSEYLGGEKPSGRGGKDPKSSSADVLADLLTKYLADEEFKANRERFQQAAGERLRGLRDRYRKARRPPEVVARERELSLRLAEVEAEAAELRLRLAELLEEEGRLRGDLEGL